MDLKIALALNNGIARVSLLRELGVSTHVMAAALKAKRAIRPARGWLALPDADAELLGAAYRSVVLSCVTQARRLGLWVYDEPQLHVAARSPHSRVKPGSCVVHWGHPVIPRTPWALEDSLENVLAYVADCQTYEVARAVWESALNKQLTTLDRLQSLPLRPRARKLAHESTPFSDSGLETFVLARLRWLRVPFTPQAWVHGHRVDFLIGKRLILQIDGGDHVGAQRLSDNRHDSTLTLNGYFVLRVGYKQVVEDWPTVQHEIMTAIAQGLHLPRSLRRLSA